MKVRDEAKWAEWQEKNPLPVLEGVTDDPATWPSMDQMSTMEGDPIGDLYGRCVLVAAEHWADLMEPHAEAGEAFADFAHPTFGETDEWLGIWGLTGFQYGAVISVLSDIWEHGEALRTWHNLETQLGDEGERANAEGGVLNPALLSISEPE